jgi:hypothetical protein
MRRKPNRTTNTAEHRATHNAVERQRREILNNRFLVRLSPFLSTPKIFFFLFKASQLDPSFPSSNDRIGKADINRGYYSNRNPRLKGFIFHDSMGFEPGSATESSIVTHFLQDRAECNAEILEQAHAIR